MMSWKNRLSSLRLGATDVVFNDTYFKGGGVVFYLYALVSSKTGTNLPGVDEGWTKPVKAVPKQVAGELAKPDLVKAEELAERGELWWISVGSDAEGKGWDWTRKNGAKDAAAVHSVLSFLLMFKTKSSVQGAKAFYVEINNKVIGL
jgi:hypothetical protein